MLLGFPGTPSFFDVKLLLSLGHIPIPPPLKFFFEYKIQTLEIDDPAAPPVSGPGPPRQVNIMKPSASELKKRELKDSTKKRPASQLPLKRPAAKRPAAADQSAAPPAESETKDSAAADHPQPDGEEPEPSKFGCSKCKWGKKGCGQRRKWANEGKNNREIVNGMVVVHSM